MKGDGIINITIKILGLGYNDKFQASYKIYDSNVVILEGQTYNGMINVCLKANHVYKIVLSNKSKTIQKIFYTNTNNFIFNFNSIGYRTIIFSLRDYYYNLPIERGELILWQNQ